MEENAFVDKYQIIEKISEGNFGTVFKAQNKETGEIVAMKRIYTTSIKKSKNICQREIDILNSFNHENIIKLIEFEVKQTQIVLILEYIEYDLLQFIENSKYPLKNSIVITNFRRFQYVNKIKNKKIKEIIQQIITAVNEIHSKNIIHRDLKPSNILINEQGVIKICDFGSAIFLNDKVNGQFEIEGFSRVFNEKILSPEMLFGSRNYNQQIDIWAMGCIFAEILNGYPLFCGVNEIDQISRIAYILGSPTEKNWQNIKEMPDFGKILFNEQDPKNLFQIFPNALNQEIDFLGEFLKYQDRIQIQQCLSHAYFNKLPNPEKLQEISLNKKERFNYEFDYQKLILQ